MKKKFTTTLDDRLLREVKIMAIKENRSVANLLERLIERYLRENNTFDFTNPTD